MANDIEFILKLKDMVSGGMNAISSTATQAFKNVNAGLDASKKKMDVLPRSIAGINKELDKLKQVRELSVSARQVKDANKEIAKLQSDLDKLEGNKGGGGSALMRRFGVAAVGAGMMAFGGQSVQAAMNYGATNKSFEVLTGSAQKGRDLAGSLNSLQQTTILGPEVFAAAQTMMGFGVETEKVVKVQKQLGDVSMGNKDKFESLALVYSQTQATGRLMGQDLLQYINAGFNPLTVMSERWQEFGLKSKKSVGELKDMMEKGQISSAAVAKAFELATSSGGKFNNMMNQIGETSYGKMQIMEGAWENMKINIGNALMPIADSAMQAGSKLMDFLNISKTVPETLIAERAEINALVGAIGNLNMGNSTRTALIQQLITKYPDLFKNLDAEKVSNIELLKSINDINAAYDKKIAYAANDLVIDNTTKELKDAYERYNKYGHLIELNKNGEYATERKTRSVADAINAAKWTNTRQEYYKGEHNVAKGDIDRLTTVLNKKTEIKQWNEAADLIKKAHDLYVAPISERQATFGKDRNREVAFDKIAGSIQQLANGQWKIYGGQAGGWQNYLKKLMGMLPADNAAATALITYPTKKGKAAGGGGDSRADGIIGGGGKNVIINMRQFMENLNIYSQNLTEGIEEMENKVLDGLGRVLESANAIKN